MEQPPIAEPPAASHGSAAPGQAGLRSPGSSRTPNAEHIDPSGQRPHGYYRDCFFSTLAPCEREVEWNGHKNTVSLRILEADEQRWCSQYAYERSQGRPEAEAYLQARTIALIAKALEAVDGKPLADECKTLEHRLQLAAELPDTLQEALIAAYDEARYEPIKLVQEMAEQPNFAPTPTESGASSVGVPSPQEA
jgi:hypothetical protein